MSNRRSTKKISCIIFIITVLLFLSSQGYAQSITPYINYQGHLVDQATNIPVTGVKQIIFSLYDGATGVTPIYYQTQSVEVTNGIFSVYLGKGEGYYQGGQVTDGIPEEVFANHSTLYLGIKMANSASEMTPRQLLASVPYAYKAERAKESESVMGQIMVETVTGNVGIGTTSPLYPLTIYHDFTLQEGSHLALFRPDRESAVYLSFCSEDRLPNNGGGEWAIGVPSEGEKGLNGRSLTIWPQGIAYPLITLTHPDEQSGGNVGIGTIEPLLPLHIKGNADRKGLFLEEAMVVFSGITTDSPKLNLFRDYNEWAKHHGILRLRSEGGNPSGATIFSIDAPFSNPAEATLGLVLSDSIWEEIVDLYNMRGTSNHWGLNYIKSGSGAQFRPFAITFQDSNDWSEKRVLEILPTGNVGIGTTNPSEKLDVAGTVKATSFIGDGSQLTGIISSGSGQWSNGAGGIYYNGGNVGIGTTSPVAGYSTMTKVLSIGDGTNVHSALRLNEDQGDGFEFVVDSDKLYIRDAGVGAFTNEWVTILGSNGNVGIGTANPQAKLDVEGTVQAHAFDTGDIVFRKDGEKLWRMFEDEKGLYLESLKTGETSRVFLEKDVETLRTENKSLEARISALERAIEQLINSGQ